MDKLISRTDTPFFSRSRANLIGDMIGIENQLLPILQKLIRAHEFIEFYVD